MVGSEPFFVMRAGEVWACWLDGKPAVNLGSEQNFWAAADKLYNEIHPAPSGDLASASAKELAEKVSKPEEDKTLAPAVERIEDRHEVTIIGRLYGSVGSNEVVIYDLSERGCRIDDTSNAKPGSFVTIKIGTVGPVPAMVRWKRGKSVGLRFNEPLHPSILTHIRQQLSLR